MRKKPNSKSARVRREKRKSDRSHRKGRERKRARPILTAHESYATGGSAIATESNASLHPSVRHMHPYMAAEQIFGKVMTAADLIDRIRTYSWKWSFRRLAELAALVANTPDGHRSEVVKKRTIDPLLDLTARPDSAGLINRCRAFVIPNRDTIVLAHEEAISFLQHLVLLEGADDGLVPTDGEISLWLAGANGHLSNWSSDPGRPYSEAERLMAEMSRISRFNNCPDVLRELVRTYLIFGTAPPHGRLAVEGGWNRLQQEAFANLGFEQFFEAVLGPLYMLASLLWGVADGSYPIPIVNLRDFFSKTSMPEHEVVALLRSMCGTRASLRDQIRKRLRSDGLPHAPTALLHVPFVEVEPNVLIGSSPGAVLSQLRTGLWWRYLSACKKIDPKNGAETWLSSFGYMVEYWCRRIATEARNTQRLAQILLSESAGSPDEIEDVVVTESDAVVLFSVKSRLMDARAAREAVSPDLTVDWLENFFFENKGDDHRGGAIRLLNARVDRLRAGEFEKFGLSRTSRVYPVIVTYDNLCAIDLHYQWLDERCQSHQLLQQEGVGPFALARLAEFEELMALLTQKRSIVSLLRRRESKDKHRCLDQMLYEEGRPPRLPFFDDQHSKLQARIRARLFGGEKRLS